MTLLVTWASLDYLREGTDVDSHITFDIYGLPGERNKSSLALQSHADWPGGNDNIMQSMLQKPLGRAPNLACEEVRKACRYRQRQQEPSRMTQKEGVGERTFCAEKLHMQRHGRVPLWES